MVRTVRKEIRRGRALAKPPMILNLLGQETDREPMRSLMARAREAERRPGLLSVSLMAGFPYADVPEMGPSVIAVADGDATRPGAGRRRRAGGADVGGPPRAVRPLPGSGGGGAPGPRVRSKTRSSSSISATTSAAARRATARCCWRSCSGSGRPGPWSCSTTRTRSRLPGRRVPEAASSAPSAGGSIGFTATRSAFGAWSIRCTTGPGSKTRPGTAGAGSTTRGRRPSSTIDGPNTLVLNSLRTPPFSLGQLTSLGIDPARQAILVVKAAVAYKAAYGPIAGRVIEVDTPGLTAINPARFTFRHIRRPMFPLDD